MSLNIVLIAPPWYSVPPHGYGGIELVVSLLDRELRRRGHQVTLIAAEGSAGALPCAPRGWHRELGSLQQGVREATYASSVARVLDKLGRIDVIHDHAGAATLVAMAVGSDAPVLHTVHGPLTEPERTLYANLAPTVALVAISESQRASARDLNWAGTVFNAVDFNNLEVGARSEREPYLLCLARVCEDKGQHVALEVARRAGMRLVLAGKVEPTPEGIAYFSREIAPSLDGDRVVHIPNVVGSEKTRLLSRATALLAPLQWDEPFGLAMVEAMASGTPVIATRRGAAPELIRQDVTGFLAADVDAMVEAVGDAGSIDPHNCARVTRAKFSMDAMAEGYVGVYERATAGVSTAVA